MGRIIEIKENGLSAKINTFGAELISLCKNGMEYLWQADPKIWNRSAPVLFPICGRLNGGAYTYCGKKYDLGLHGFALNSEFEVESAEDFRVCFILKSNDETRAVYPFDFEFRVIFEIRNDKLYITYKVDNCTDGNMYFSFGAHESYACPEGVENHFIEFDNDEKLERIMLDQGFVNGKTENISLDNHRLPLDYSEFEKCTYVFYSHKSRSVILSSLNEKRKIRVGFDGFPTLAFWTKNKCKYLCIEPWCAKLEDTGSVCDISNKNGITKLEKNASFDLTHYIEIL